MIYFDDVNPEDTFVSLVKRKIFRALHIDTKDQRLSIKVCPKENQTGNRFQVLVDNLTLLAQGIKTTADGNTPVYLENLQLGLIMPKDVDLPGDEPCHDSQKTNEAVSCTGLVSSESPVLTHVVACLNYPRRNN